MSTVDYNIIKHLFIREFTFRYRRSVLGIGWTLLNPLLTSIVLWIVFAQRFGEELDVGQKYAPFLVAGILVQTYFNQGIMSTSNCLTDNASILSKIPIKPHLFVLAYAFTGLVNFFAGLIPLWITCLLSDQSVSVTFPICFFIGIELSLLISGLSFFLATLILRYQDMRNLIGFLLSLSVFVTPIFYPINSLPSQVQDFVLLNPLTSIVKSLRWAFSSNEEFSIFSFVYPTFFAVLIFVLGYQHLNRKWKSLVILL